MLSTWSWFSIVLLRIVAPIQIHSYLVTSKQQPVRQWQRCAEVPERRGSQRRGRGKGFRILAARRPFPARRTLERMPHFDPHGDAASQDDHGGHRQLVPTPAFAATDFTGAGHASCLCVWGGSRVRGDVSGFGAFPSLLACVLLSAGPRAALRGPVAQPCRNP